MTSDSITIYIKPRFNLPITVQYKTQ